MKFFAAICAILFGAAAALPAEPAAAKVHSRVPRRIRWPTREDYDYDYDLAPFMRSTTQTATSLRKKNYVMSCKEWWDTVAVDIDLDQGECERVYDGDRACTRWTGWTGYRKCTPRFCCRPYNTAPFKLKAPQIFGFGGA